MARVSRVSSITGDCSPSDWSRMLGDGLVRRGTARDRQVSKRPTSAKEDVPRRIFVAVAKGGRGGYTTLVWFLRLS